MERKTVRPDRACSRSAAPSRGSGGDRDRRTVHRPSSAAAASASRSPGGRACARPSTAGPGGAAAAARSQPPDDRVASRSVPTEEADREIECPADGFRRPGRDAVRHVEQMGAAMVLAIGTSFTITTPRSAGRTPAMHSNRVVFPAPFGPIRPSTSPSRTVRATSVRAAMPPYRLCRARTRSAGIIDRESGRLRRTGLYR